MFFSYTVCSFYLSSHMLYNKVDYAVGLTLMTMTRHEFAINRANANYQAYETLS